MSFDWTTFGLQLINVIVLLLLLRHFLFRPLSAALAQRRAREQSERDAVAALRQQAAELTSKLLAEEQDLEAKRTEQLAAAVQQAEEHRARLLQEAQEQAERLVDAGRKQLQDEANTRTQQAVAAVRDLSVAICKRALREQPSWPDGYVTRLVTALRAMPPRQRQALFGDEVATLASATPLPDAEVARLNAELSQLGIQTQTTLAPDLIVGLELQSNSGVLHNSLAHDLDLLCLAMTKADTNV